MATSTEDWNNSQKEIDADQEDHYGTASKPINRAYTQQEQRSVQTIPYRFSDMAFTDGK